MRIARVIKENGELAVRIEYDTGLVEQFIVDKIIIDTEDLRVTNDGLV